MVAFSKSWLSYSSFRLSLATGGAFVLVAVIIVALVYSSERQHALDDAETRAMIILNRHLAIHTYFNKEMKPRLFEWSQPFRKADYFDPSWMSSTFAVREIDRIVKALGMGDYYYKECAINSRSPLNEADDFEKRFITELNADPRVEKASGVRFIEGKPFFYVLRRGEVMEESCMRCHSVPSKAPGGMIVKYGAERSFHRAVGEVVSAVSIRIPLDKAYARADALALEFSGLLLVLLVLLFSAQFLFSQKLLFSPLLLMRDKALRITDNRESLGEQIPVPSGRELKELATAFNEMSAGLRRNVDELEARVRERTAELEQLNQRLNADVEERKKILGEREKLIFELKESMAKVKTLGGLLPICASCKKIRDDKGYWAQIEVYLRDHSEAEFTHGLCPDCAAKAYAEVEKLKRKRT